MKIVIVGCGSIASRWVRTLHTDPRVTIAGLVDTEVARADRLAERYDLRVPRFASLPDALASRPYDVMVNLTPPDAHAAVSRAALAAGLHVFTEKPLATSLDDATGLVSLAERVGRSIAVMQNRGRDPGFRSFCDKINGNAGPFAVAADVCVELRQPGFRVNQPMPATSDLAVHAFDQVQAIIAASPAWIMCTETATPFLGSHCSLTTITIEFADGSVFTYRGGYSGGGLHTSANGHWRVDGDGFAARWTDQPSTLADDPRSRSNAAPASQWGPPGYQVCITAMIDALHRRSAPSATVNLRSIALLDAALTSATTRRAVAVVRFPGGRP